MKVHFIQDNSFFRTEKGTNPFFDPIIRVCEENGIKWKVFTRFPYDKCGYDATHIECFDRFERISVWFWRIAHLVWWVETWRIYCLFGRLMRPFWGRKFKADVFITIAGNMVEQLSGMFPDVRNVDMQHGVIYSKHVGYFDSNARLREVYQKLTNREFWLYGQGYADCFFKNPENAKDLEGRVKVIGDVFGHVEVAKQIRNLVVVSAQFKPECTRECLGKQVVLLRNFLKEFYRVVGDQYEVLIKHHPRCAGVEALSVLYSEFPKFKETKETWPDLYGRMMLHVTISSTVVFDAASNGIPTYLIDPPADEPILENRFWRDDYGYPYFGKPLADLARMANSEDVHKEMRMWYNYFYTPFTETQCKNLLGLAAS